MGPCVGSSLSGKKPNPSRAVLRTGNGSLHFGDPIARAQLEVAHAAHIRTGVELRDVCEVRALVVFPTDFLALKLVGHSLVSNVIAKNVNVVAEAA